MPPELKPVLGDIAVVGLPGSYLSGVGTVVDALTLIAGQVQHMFAAPYKLAMESRVVTLVTQGRSLDLAGGRKLTADGDLEWSGPLQLIYVGAFEARDDKQLNGVLARQTRLLDWLRKQHSRGAVIGSSGVANFLLAEAGLLEDGSAAVPGTLAPSFRRRYPKIKLEKRLRIVESKGTFTAGGMADDWGLAVRMVERCLSPHVSRWLATATGLRADHDESLAEDPLVASAQFWLGQRFARPLRIAQLAQELSVSHTTLLRRFERSLATTPRHYVQRLRMESAKKMLLSTKRPIHQVSNMVGYADARSFRLAFTEHTGMSPRRYREAAAAPARRTRRASS